MSPERGDRTPGGKARRARAHPAGGDAAARRAYVPAVRTGSYVYTAGQLPVVDGKLLATGKVGAEVGAAEASRAGPDLRAERAGRRRRR